MAEAFGVMLSKAFQGGLLEGFQVGRSDLKISHLQFVDDTLVFCKQSISQLTLLRCVIRCFEAILGLKVNLSKSCIYGVGQVNDLWRFVEVLGCQMGVLPTSYLRLPLGTPL